MLSRPIPAVRIFLSFSLSIYLTSFIPSSSDSLSTSLALVIIVIVVQFCVTTRFVG